MFRHKLLTLVVKYHENDSETNSPCYICLTSCCTHDDMNIIPYYFLREKWPLH